VAVRSRGALTFLAAVAGGAIAGFLAERALVHRRVEPRGTRPTLGSIAGELEVSTAPTARGSRSSATARGRAAAGAVPRLGVHRARLARAGARLADRYRLITYDQPGHGRTTPPASGTYSLDLLGDTLRRVIEVAARPGPLVLAGHSMGGMTILNAVRRHGDLLDDRLRGVVLLSTTSHAATAAPPVVRRSIQGWARLDRAVRRAGPAPARPAADRPQRPGHVGDQ
jgi:alpha-beta hydrolase superfamily lysophospholipase